MTVDFRTPPHNPEAEQALLGAILHNNCAYEAVSEFLRPEHFAEPVHGRIYAACARMIDAGRRADPVTLRGAMDDDPALAEMGGIAGYTAGLMVAAIPPSVAANYGRIVHDLHQRRELIAAALDLQTAAYDTASGRTATQEQEAHEARLFGLVSAVGTDGELRDLATFSASALAQYERAYQNRGRVVGIPTGVIDLDRRLGGLNPTDLIILAGRPGMGKTALAVSMAVGAARQGKRAAIFSLEMSGQQLAGRIVSAHAGVSGDKARRGELSPAEFARLAEAEAEIRDLPIAIDDTPAVTVQAIRNRARRRKRKGGLDLVVVDYIGLASPENGSAQMVHQIAEITKGLKALAKELDVPVLALSQLSRAVEQREDKRPMLADLRDSGAIEQDADDVLFVFRDQYYLERAEPVRRADESDQKYGERVTAWNDRMAECRGMAEVIIAKNRHGPLGTVRLAFDGPTTSFSNLAHGATDE